MLSSDTCRISGHSAFAASWNIARSSRGSETPDAILAETVDASAEDKQAVVYFSGEFNENALQLGTGHTVESIRAGLRSKSIFLRSNQS